MLLRGELLEDSLGTLLSAVAQKLLVTLVSIVACVWHLQLGCEIWCHMISTEPIAVICKLAHSQKCMYVQGDMYSVI